ncbi:MAG: hypothetical protein HFG72_09965 [Hungatella sp.]|jgi:hypothetical protein|nr:hypothetical protein [Hungatella sp.]
MFVEDIKILPWFKATPPKPEKMERKERYYLEHGDFESRIVLDRVGNLVDGYINYLLAVKYGLKHVFVRYGRRQVVIAAHKPGGKLYVWELPGSLTGKVQVGDKVVVQSSKGPRIVRVAGVQEYGSQEHEPHRMVIKCCRKGGRADGNQRVNQNDNQ